MCFAIRWYSPAHDTALEILELLVFSFFGELEHVKYSLKLARNSILQVQMFSNIPIFLIYPMLETTQNEQHLQVDTPPSQPKSTLTSLNLGNAQMLTSCGHLEFGILSKVLNRKQLNR